jgi:HPt (histidine-containing phosphotransfer) domain-containing protein
MTNSLNQETLAALQELDKPGKLDFITEIIQTYLKDTEVRFKDMWMMHASGNADGLAKTAHAIKGSSLNVGVDGLAEMMRTVELEGKSGVLSRREYLAESEALFQRAKVDLGRFLG